MKTTDKIDAARIDLLLGELRLSGVKLVWSVILGKHGCLRERPSTLSTSEGGAPVRGKLSPPSEGPDDASHLPREIGISRRTPM